MINDQNVQSDISQQWKTVKKLCTNGQMEYMVNGMIINQIQASESCNLPFVLAYAVLDQVLGELMIQGEFQCKGRKQLGDKMIASENILPWQYYGNITNGRIDRNALAHETKLLHNDKCIEYINAIEEELKAWKIL